MLVHKVVHVALPGGHGRNPLDYRQVAGRREVRVPGCHRDRLVACCLLDLFRRSSGHREPRTECVTVGVPSVASDSRYFQAGSKR